jgi:CheY-like chemotaxis protein
VRHTSRRLLERAGFHVLLAADGAEAIKVLQSHPNQVACALLDLTMPGLSGEECLRELQRIKPSLPVVLSSGYSEHEVSQRVGDLAFAGFIQKPYTFLDLVAKVRHAMQV